MGLLYFLIVISLCLMSDISCFFITHMHYLYCIPLLFIMHIVNQHTMSQLALLIFFLYGELFLIYGTNTLAFMYIFVGIGAHILFSRSIYAHFSASIAAFTGFLLLQIYVIEPYMLGFYPHFFYTIEKLIANLIVVMIFSLTVKTQGKLSNRL
jgi:hypothetical protein